MTTEENIKKATKELLLKEGCFDLTLREISEYAKIDRTVIHYYFRSKDNLFTKVLKELLDEFMVTQYLQMSLDLSLKEKVSRYIDSADKILVKYPYLDIYVMMQLNKNESISYFNDSTLSFIKKIIGEIHEAIEDGNTNYKNPLHFLSDMISLTSCPYFILNFLGKAGLSINENTLDTILKSRKEKIMNTLFCK